MMWEDEPLEKLTEDNQLVAYRHKGFWKCMDALRDKMELEASLAIRPRKMESLVMLPQLSSYYNGKKVFITGHTGFKGAWLTS